MKKRNLNFLNLFYNEYSDNAMNIKTKKKKKYFINNNTTIQNNISPKTEEKLSLSYETYTKNLDIDEIKKNCIMKTKCPYYLNYIELKNKINGLLFSINRIKKTNEILINSLERQTKLYQNLINENKILKEELFDISSQKKFLYKYKNKRKIENNKYIPEENKKNKININQFLDKEIKSLKSFSLKNIFNLKENSEEYKEIFDINTKIKINKKNLNKKLLLNKDNILTIRTPSMKNIRNNNLIYNKSSKKHYDLIKGFTNQQKINFISDKIKRSLLSENIDYDTLIQNNKILNELIQLTQTEDNFILKIKDKSNDICYKLYDMISILIKDHKDIIKLGFKLKDFIKYNIILMENNIDNNNTIKILIKNICEILSCKQVNIYILDKISDSLIIYSNNNNNGNHISKDKGIIGECFLENKKLRIDDDKNSILIYPLLDKNEQCIGILEANNKIIPPFDIEDEELAKLLSYQISNIFININSNNDNKYLINKLYEIIDYNINLINIKSKFEFTDITEKILLKLFNCTKSKFYFIENNKIIYYNNNNKTRNEFDINMGIIGKIIKIKNIYGIKNVENCSEYNSLVDINSVYTLLTFPILEHKTKNVKGVVQIPYVGTINKNNKPKEIDLKLIKKFRKCIKYWLYYHDF